MADHEVERQRKQWQKKNPIVLADAPEIAPEQYQHLGRYAGAMVMACFQQMGGLESLVSWAGENPDAFYTKLYPKMIATAKHVEVSGEVSLDSALAKLDALNAIDLDSSGD